MTDGWIERRQSRRRRSLEDHGVVSTQVRPGRQVLLIDISAGGALIEAAHRLLPGRVLDLRVQRAEHRTSIRGRLLRCTITQLQSSSVCYRGAIAFDDRLPWLVDEDLIGYSVPNEKTLVEEPLG